MSENKTLRVLRVEPGKTPVEKEIGVDLKSLQAEVEGMIECVYMEDGSILVCNEEGKLNGMALNRRLADDIICGPFFVVGDDGRSRTTRSVLPSRSSLRITNLMRSHLCGSQLFKEAAR